MSLKKLTDTIYYLPFEKELDRPSLGYIIGEDKVLVVDAGNSPAHYQYFCEELKKNHLKVPDYCVLTHWHWDHTFGLSAVNVPVFAHELTNEKLIEMSQWEWSLEALQRRVEEGIEIEFCAEHILKEYKDLSKINISQASICFSDKMTINLGNKKVELIHLDSSHGEDNVVVYIPDEKIVFLGDIYTEDYYHQQAIYADRNRSLYESLKALDFEIGMHSHVVPQSKEEILAILEEMQRQAR